MEPNRPSLTAHRVAMLRAAHQILDDPRVFDDPIALRIVGEQSSSGISSAPDQYRTPIATYLRAFLVARSKYAEDSLAEAIKRGVRQYVILGAGLDTFAYRNPYPSGTLRVFEVDHPCTQAWKRERLDAEHISMPQSLCFVPVDFEKEALEGQLLKAGVRTDEPSFFSWLGVTMYLPADAVMATMRSIALSAARGSEIVFDYALSPSALGPGDLSDYRAMAARVAALGEPWRSAFDPDLLSADLRAMGLTPAEDLGPDELNARFFKERTDALRVGGRARLIKVIVWKYPCEGTPDIEQSHAEAGDLL
jgi:methyltransferase (TIGR00027 family)